MKINKILLIVLSLALCICFLAACTTNGTESTSATTTKNDLGNIDDDDISSDYDDKNSTKIVFSNDVVTIKGIGASARGTEVRIGAQGTYVLSGSSNSGSIIIDAGKNEVKLVLNGLSLSNNDGPVILVKNAKKVTFTLVEGTNNILSDGALYYLYEGNATVDGTIFAKSELVFNGTGSLTVNGNNAHGIVSKDGLIIAGGNIDVVSKSAGICGKDYIKVANANITINAGTDGLRSDNINDAGMGYIAIQGGNFDITSANDAIQAQDEVKIEGGSFKIKTTSTDALASAKGIKGVKSVKILGGSFVVDSIDDAIHSDGNVHISGGEISISSLDDGIHANNELLISNGDVVIHKSYEGLEATLIKISGGDIEINSTDDGMNSAGGNDQSAGDDSFAGNNGGIVIEGGYIAIHSGADGIDTVGAFNMSAGVLLVDGPSSIKSGALDFGSTASITGGVVVALGLSDSASSFTDATQGVALVNNINYAANTVYSICDEGGNVIIAFKSTKEFNGMLISAPEFNVGATYTVYKGASVLGLDKNGFAHNTTQNGGEKCASISFE